MRWRSAVLLIAVICIGSGLGAETDSKWIPLFNGKDLTGWTVRGKAVWSVQKGVLVGVGGMGHIYADPICSDFEVKGMFRVTSQGATPNSGFYFRAVPPADDPNGFPRGYEAQICNHGDGYTGWLWKPGETHRASNGSPYQRRRMVQLPHAGRRHTHPILD